MSMDFVRFGIIVLFTTPTAVELSVWIGEGGCFHPISINVWRKCTIFFAVTNNAASSSAAANAADLDVKEKIRMNAKPNTKLGRSKSPSESGKKFGSARSGA